MPWKTRTTTVADVDGGVVVFEVLVIYSSCCFPFPFSCCRHCCVTISFRIQLLLLLLYFTIIYILFRIFRLFQYFFLFFALVLAFTFSTHVITLTWALRSNERFGKTQKTMCLLLKLVLATRTNASTLVRMKGKGLETSD